MKTYMFEGKEYVENGKVKPPQYGEAFSHGGEVHIAHFNFQNDKYPILIPKEATMKYKKTDKIMSQESVLGEMTSAEKECSEAREEYTKFMKSFSKEGYTFWGGIGYDEKRTDYFLNQYLKDNPHLYPWLVKHGFLEEVKPEWKSVALMIETEEEYQLLWHKLNIGPEKFEEAYDFDNTGVLWPSNADTINTRLWTRLDRIKEPK